MGDTKKKDPSAVVARVQPKALVISAAVPSQSLTKVEPREIVKPTAEDSYMADFKSAQETLSRHVTANTSKLFYIETDSRLFDQIQLNLLINQNDNRVVIHIEHFNSHKSTEHVFRDVAGRLYKHGLYRYKYEVIHEARKINTHKRRNAIIRLGKSLSKIFLKTKESDIFEHYDKRYELERASIEGSTSAYKATHSMQEAEKLSLAMNAEVSGGLGAKHETTTVTPPADSKDPKAEKDSKKTEATHGVQAKVGGSRTTEVTETVTSTLESAGQLPPRNPSQIVDTINIFFEEFNKNYPDVHTVFLFEGSLTLHQNPSFLQTITQLSAAKNTFVVTKVPMPAPVRLATATRLAIFHGPPTRVYQLRSAVAKYRRALIVTSLSILIILSVFLAVRFFWKKTRPEIVRPSSPIAGPELPSEPVQPPPSREPPVPAYPATVSPPAPTPPKAKTNQTPKKPKKKSGFPNQ